MQKSPNGKGPKWVTPEKAFQEMKGQKTKGRAAFWKGFEPVIEEKFRWPGDKKCWLKCMKEGGHADSSSASTTHTGQPRTFVTEVMLAAKATLEQSASMWDT
eukprot:54674-Eustigmatos_ZCMA.PRE.1